MWANQEKIMLLQITSELNRLKGEFHIIWLTKNLNLFVIVMKSNDNEQIIRHKKHKKHQYHKPIHDPD